MILTTSTHKLVPRESPETFFSRVAGDYAVLFQEGDTAFIGFKPAFALTYEPPNMKVSTFSYLPESIEEEAQVFEGDPWKMIAALVEQLKPKQKKLLPQALFPGGAVGVKMGDRLEFAFYDRVIAVNLQTGVTTFFSLAGDEREGKLMLENMQYDMTLPHNSHIIPPHTTIFYLPESEITVQSDRAAQATLEQVKRPEGNYIGYIACNGNANFLAV